MDQISQLNKFYFIDNKYKNFENGAIVQYDGNCVWQIQDDLKLELNESPPSNWITISQNEAHFLKGKISSQRSYIYHSRMFDSVDKLKKNDQCIYFDGNLKHKCTIVDRNDTNNGLCFTVMDDGKEGNLNVCANDIELSSEDRHIDKIYYFSLDKYKIDESSGIVVINDGQLKNYLGQNISNISVEDVQDSYVEIIPDEARSLYNVYVKWKLDLEEKRKHLNSRLSTINKDQSTVDKKISIFDNSENFTKESCDRLKNVYENIISKSYNNNEVLKQFEGDAFIQLTKQALESSLVIIKDHKYNDNWKIDFTVVTLGILCHVSRENKNFVFKIRTDSGIMNEIKQMFDILTKKDKLATKEEHIINNILYLYWCILRSGPNVTIPISEAMEHCFKDSKCDKQIKIGMALCLSYLTVSSCPLLGELYVYLSNICSESPLDEQYFTRDDILIGLGTLSLNLDYDHILLGKLWKSLNNITESLKADRIFQFTQELNEDLKNLYENFFKTNEDSIKLYMSDKFLRMITVILEIFHKSVISNEEQMVLDFVMTSLYMVNDFCNTNPTFCRVITGNITLMCLLKEIFNKLTNKIEPMEHIEEEFLKMVIIIFWNILKSGQTLGKEVTLTMESCYNNAHIDVQIKVAAALCLSSLSDIRYELMDHVEKFFEKLINMDSSCDIYGFPRTDILIGVANLAVMSKRISKKLSDVPDQLNTNEDKRKEEKEAEIETIPIRGVTKEEYERCLLILSDGRKPPSYDEIITLIVSATKMCDYQILTNIITSSKGPIIFEKSPNVLSLIIDLKDDNAIKSLLNNCIASAKEYPRLIDLAERSDDNIAGAVFKIINKSVVTSDVNVHLLTMAFSYLCENKCLLFEQCISLCPDHDAFIDDNDTFLTKIIKERNISQIKKSMNICKFDINKHNKMDEAAICIACKDENEDKVQYLMGNGDMKIIEHDIFLAKRIAWAITDENKSKRIVALLK